MAIHKPSGKRIKIRKMLPKITTRHEKEASEKKRQRMQMFFALFMVGILAVSTASFALFSSNTQQGQEYGGIPFTATENGWQGKGLNFFTFYLPQEVENILLSGTINTGNFNGKKTYVVLNAPGSENAALEWSRTVPISGLHPACLPEEESEESCAELPIKSCEDAVGNNALLIFKESNETSLRVNGGCLEVFGKEFDLVRAVDKAAFVMNGVIIA